MPDIRRVDSIQTDPWACPECGHALIRFYRRPIRRAFNQEFWRGCVSCGYEARDTSQPALTVEPRLATAYWRHVVGTAGALVLGVSSVAGVLLGRPAWWPIVGWGLAVVLIVSATRGRWR